MAGEKLDYNRLHCAVNAARLILKVPRENRLMLVKEAAGHLYGNNASAQRTKVNLLGLYQNVVAPLLVAKEPRYYLTTSDQEARAGIRIEQDWLNEQTVHVGLADTIRTVAVDGLYSTGIVQVSLASPCDAAMMAWGITAGEPVVQAIDLDDWVGPSVKDYRYADFMGHRFRCPLDVAKKLYGRAAADLSETEEQWYNREGDERIDRLFKGYYDSEEFEPHVELWQIYLPRHGLICVLADQNVLKADASGNAQPLWVQKWVGPPTGPYLFLRFGTVPGAALGKGPMSDLYELHNDSNNVHRKANATIRRLKELTLYGRNQEHDALAVKKASDGEFVPVDNPDRIKTYVSAGAALQGLFLAGQTYRDLFNYVSNVEVTGGRGPQAKTATQEKIIAAQAGSGIEHMHGEVEKLLSRVGENLLWYAHHHPELVMSAEYKAYGTPGVDRKLYPFNPQSKSTPQRDWPFDRAKLRVDPYAHRFRGPDERLGFIQGFLGLVTPLLPILAQSGVTLDANNLVEVFAELGDEPLLHDMFTAAPASADMVSGSHERTLPGNTERTYNRNSNPQPEKPGQAVNEMSPADFGGELAGAAP